MTSARRHAHVVNIEEVAADEQGQGGFGLRRAAGQTMMTAFGHPRPGKAASPRR
jgi:hypothetical protein